MRPFIILFYLLTLLATVTALPDYVVFVTVDHVSATSVTARIITMNAGDASMQGSFTNVDVNHSESNTSMATPALGHDAMDTFSISTRCFPEETFSITAVADILDVIDEDYEDNNVVERVVTCLPFSQNATPDLVTSITGPISMERGHWANFTLTTTNVGRDRSFSSLTYVLGTNARQYPSTLMPGQSRSITFNWQCPAGGRNVLTAVADYSNSNVEWNENNNQGNFTVTCVQRADAPPEIALTDSP